MAVIPFPARAAAAPTENPTSGLPRLPRYPAGTLVKCGSMLGRVEGHRADRGSYVYALRLDSGSVIHAREGGLTLAVRPLLTPAPVPVPVTRQRRPGLAVVAAMAGIAVSALLGGMGRL